MSVSLYDLITQAVRWAWCAQLAGPGSSVSGSRLLKETFHNLQNAVFLLLPAKHSCISKRIEEEYWTSRLCSWNFKEWILREVGWHKAEAIRMLILFRDRISHEKISQNVALPSFKGRDQWESRRVWRVANDRNIIGTVVIDVRF